MDYSYDLYKGVQSYIMDPPSPTEAPANAISSRNTSTVSSRASTPMSTSKFSDVEKANEKIVYHPQTGMFQPAGTSEAVKKVAVTSQKQPKNTFSSMPSSMNRPKGSVFQRALFSVGYQTKGNCRSDE